jgi:hypothetical protein
MTSHAIRLPAMRRRHEPAEPVVTYRRLPPDGASLAEGRRVEPWFADVDPSAAAFDEIAALPEVEDPPSIASLDPLAGVSAGEIRTPGARRGPRVALVVGLLALVAGGGVLAAALGGAIKSGVGLPSGTTVEAPHAPTTVAALGGDDNTATAPTGVRVVPLSGAEPDRNAALVGGIAPGVDTATRDASGVVVADPPMPRLRPAMASASDPQAAAFDGGSTSPSATGVANPSPAPAGLEASASATASGGDVDQALASVDRVLAEQQARSATLAPTAATVDPLASPVGGGLQPLPYPPLEPLPGAAAASGDPQVLAGEPSYGDGMVVEEAAPAGPWWLPKRRIFRIPGPTPPAEIPNAGSYRTW